MASLVQDLNSLDFSVYLGGPLQAAIQAQNSASLAQADFIKEVGFDNSDPKKPVIRTVEFEVSEKDSVGKEITRTVSVPLLSILTLPAIRVDTLAVDFNVKLTSVATDSTTTAAAASAEVSGGFKKVGFKVAASYQKNTSSSVTVSKSFDLAVRMTAVNDDLPAGLERVLELLAAPAQTAAPAPQ